MNHLNTAQIKIPSTDKEAWVKYPKVNWVYLTHKLLEFQKIKWYPFSIEGVTNTKLASYSLGEPILGTDGMIYIEEELNLTDVRTKVDAVICRGQIVDEVHYTEDTEGNVTPKTTYAISGKVELLIQSILVWHFDKFSGIVSVEYVDDTIIAFRLTPHTYAKEFYPDHILRNLNGLYTKKKWVKPKNVTA
jgi:hypothetical protein